MARYSVIDLGSNTIRLVVYDVRDHMHSIRKYKSTDKSKLFKDAINEKKTAGLSTYVIDGIFTEAGIDKAVDVLSTLLDIAKNVKSDKTRIFATAVLRNCENSKEAVSAIESRIGKKIDLLSAVEEAHLGYIGATCTTPANTGTLIDIGGGSTELTTMTKNGDKHNVSLGMGSVSSYAKYVEMVLPKKSEMKRIEEAFQSKLEGLDDLKSYKSDIAYGIGGSIRAVAKIGALIFGDGVKPKEFTIEQLDSVLNLLEDDPETFAHLAVRAVPDRLHSLVPGATILRTCMKAFDAKSIQVRKYGVREGYLLERMLKV